MPTLTIRDGALGGATLHEFSLDVLTERITLRELIRSRVYQEVQDHNVRQPEHVRMLVQPEGAELALGGAFRLRERRSIEWKPQFDRAIEAFERRGLLVLVDDGQVADLDAEVVVGPRTTVTFVRLLPLVGG